jgi:hypothetical protein
VVGGSDRYRHRLDAAHGVLYSAGASATYGHTATAANGSGWTAVGQTASSFTWYVPAGLSASAPTTGIYYSAYLALSGSSSASASSLTAVHTMLRLAATGITANGAVSARLLTSSGQEFRAVWTARIQG